MNSDFKYTVNYTDEDAAKRVRLWFINEWVRRLIDVEHPNIYEEAEKEFEEFIKTLPSEDQQILNLSLRRKES